MRLGRFTVWIVTDAEVARQVLLTDEANWVRPSYFTVPIRQAIGGQPLLSLRTRLAGNQAVPGPAIPQLVLLQQTSTGGGDGR